MFIINSVEIWGAVLSFDIPSDDDVQVLFHLRTAHVDVAATLYTAFVPYIALPANRKIDGACSSVICSTVRELP